ncbi:MAG: hypothetical protein RL373_1861 [Pseudomonadota bacterium]|jgi:hypothetical protein
MYLVIVAKVDTEVDAVGSKIVDTIDAVVDAVVEAFILPNLEL